jgi:hypothetical protein
MALSSECEIHSWAWDKSDDMGCPVCYGIALEQGRIVKLVEDNLEYIDHEGLAYGTRILRVESLIALIEEEN